MDLEINFRKFVRDANSSGYKSTCANEEIADETGLPRMRKLAHELFAKWVRAGGPGLGRIRPGLAGSDLGWCLPADLGHAWAPPGASRARPRAWCVARLGVAPSAVPGCWPGSPELAGGRAGQRRKGEERKRKKKKRREKRVSGEGERRGRKKKKRGSGFFGLKSRIYSVRVFRKNTRSYRFTIYEIYGYHTMKPTIQSNPKKTI